MLFTEVLSKIFEIFSFLPYLQFLALMYINSKLKAVLESMLFLYNYF